MANYSSESPSNILLARQPIFDRNNRVVGYLLQFDDQAQLSKLSEPLCQLDDKQLSHVIVSAFTCAADSSLCDDGPVFIEVTSQLLLAGHLLSLPPKIVVLSVKDDMTPAQFEQIKRLYQPYDFKFAININPSNINHHPFLHTAHFIQLDISTLGLAPFAQLLRQLRHQLNRQSNQTTELIATGVDNHRQLNQCRAVDVDLVQGHFIAQPANIVGHQLNFKQNNSLQLVGELQTPGISAKRVAELISQTPQYSFRLLRLINSVAFELTRTIESIEQAVIYLGQDMVCHWVSLMVLAQSSDKPQALVITSLLRAKMCESLVKLEHPQMAPKGFLVGLLSTLDAILDIPMHQALSNLPLSDEVNQALNDHQGPLGNICEGVIAYEQGQFEQAKQTLNIANYQIFVAYGQAVIWAKNVSQQLIL